MVIIDGNNFFIAFRVRRRDGISVFRAGERRECAEREVDLGMRSNAARQTLDLGDRSRNRGQVEDANDGRGNATGADDTEQLFQVFATVLVVFVIAAVGHEILVRTPDEGPVLAGVGSSLLGPVFPLLDQLQKGGEQLDQWRAVGRVLFPAAGGDERRRTGEVFELVVGLVLSILCQNGGLGGGAVGKIVEKHADDGNAHLPIQFLHQLPVGCCFETAPNTQKDHFWFGARITRRSG